MRTTGKRNWCAAAAVALVCGFTPGLNAAENPQVWRVDAVPSVRAFCHAGDSLWVGTSAGVFVLDLRTGERIRRIGAGTRLPSASVRAIASRGDSVLVGTDDGLALFTPRGHQQWTRSAPGSLRAVPLTQLRGISFAQNGDWMLASGGSGAGIVRKSGGYTITRADSLPSDDVSSILDRPNGVRWFATSTGLFARSNDTTFVSYQAGAGLPRGRLRTMTGDAGGVFLLYAGLGVFRFDGARATPVNAGADIPLRDATSISLGPDGTLWAVGRGWIARGQGKRWQRVTVPAADAANHWSVVTADGGGAFAGSDNGVVLAIGRGADWRVSLPGVLPAGAVTGIRADGRGAAWLVCAGRPVRADAGTRTAVVENTPAATQSVAISPGGDVYAATRWTVSRRTNGVWTDLAPDVPGADPVFTAVDTDPAGRVWVSTANDDAFRFDGDVWLRVAVGNARARGVREVFADQGTLLARSLRGAGRSGGGTWHGIPGIDSSAVLVDIARSPDGAWVGATARGLWRLDAKSGRWRAVSPSTLVGAKTNRDLNAPGVITALAFDGNGRLWVGTVAGLGRIDREGTTWLGAADGLGGTAIADLAADEQSLWIGFASEGLSVVTLVPTR